MTEFSATAAAMAGFRFIKDRPLTIVIWAAAYVVMLILVVGAFVLVAGAAILPFMNDMQALERDPTALLTSPALWGGLALALVLMVLLSGVVYGALFRAFLRPEEGGLGYFRLGADELRLIGAYLLVTLLSSAVNYGGQFALGLLAQGVGGTGGMLISGLGSLVMFGLAIWLAIRLSLVLPMTFDRRRISLASAWRLTDGQFWDMLGAYILAGLICLAAFVVIAIVVSIVVTAVVASGMSGGGDGLALATAISVGLLVLVAYPLALACFMPAAMAPSAYIYRALSSDPERTAAAFA